MITELDVLFRIGLAIICGFLIGLERQLNGHIVGIKTNVLISFGSCIFVLFSFLVTDADETRIAAQVVSGVGFLCSSVIMRNGMSVNGLNTSATIWCTAGIGILSSLGLWKISFIVTLSLIASNLIFYQISDKIPTLKKINNENDGDMYKLTIFCISDNLFDIRQFIIDELSKTNFILTGVELKTDDTNNQATFKISLNHIGKTDNIALEELISILYNNKEITNVNWKLC